MRLSHRLVWVKGCGSSVLSGCFTVGCAVLCCAALCLHHAGVETLGGKYELHDLVQLDAHTAGVIVGIDKDTARVLTNQSTLQKNDIRLCRVSVGSSTEAHCFLLCSVVPCLAWVKVCFWGLPRLFCFLSWLWPLSLAEPWPKCVQPRAGTRSGYADFLQTTREQSERRYVPASPPSPDPAPIGLCLLQKNGCCHLQGNMRVLCCVLCAAGDRHCSQAAGQQGIHHRHVQQHRQRGGLCHGRGRRSSSSQSGGGRQEGEGR